MQNRTIKFTPPHLQVLVNLDRIGSDVAIRISDTGQGITSEFLPHVFDRFRQPDGGSARKHKGLGLGLSIVRHLVELHGGTVQAESEGEGRGATFTVKFPIFEPADCMVTTGDTRAEVQQQPESGDSSARLTGLRVLVVDDETDARELIKTILQLNGASR